MAMQLPYNENAEKVVLGAALMSERSAGYVMTSVVEDHFFLARHKVIFEAMRHLFDNRKPIDTTTLVDELLNTNKLNEIGGIEYLTILVDELIIEENIEFYINILKDKLLLRKILKTMEDLCQDWNENEVTDVADYLSTVENKITAITKDRRAEGFEKVDSILERVQKISIQDAKSTNELKGTPSGFKDLDRMTGGFQKGDLIILSARPSMGKTALALNFAINSIIKRNGKGTVAIFSVEMPKEQLMRRILSSQCQINSADLSRAIADESKADKIQAVFQRLSSYNLFIDDSSTIKLSDIQAKTRNLKKQHEDLQLVVVDYIGLVQANNSKGDNRQQEVAEISRGLKALARELEVPVICLAQLSRLVERRPDKRPMLSDLRESGAIEQDADLVIFIYRDEYYAQKKESDSNEETNPVAEVLIAKHRNGPTGKVNLLFTKEFGTFSNYISNEAVSRYGGED
jgi:replicative DNA helicase